MRPCLIILRGQLSSLWSAVLTSCYLLSANQVSYSSIQSVSKPYRDNNRANIAQSASSLPDGGVVTIEIEFLFSCDLYIYRNRQHKIGKLRTATWIFPLQHERLMVRRTGIWNVGNWMICQQSNRPLRNGPFTKQTRRKQVNIIISWFWRQILILTCRFFSLVFIQYHRFPAIDNTMVHGIDPLKR